ncbi:LysR family transcriptional regulator [Halobacillus naozhouensis]|uniref:LysR family transcriptional regulator n=1 Tax=Halobacillus naozhouensis TaxID=554880 RepID=A0ABY8ISU5_9BACI|nr:LysR family transcriptional regulator [Halobacillus naozhouensis]WFT73003.1 LysR family transcriptional regulator [Halobacillus naozhouensis]
MEIKWVKTFSIAAEELNYRKTAEKLFITQPAVSLHIRQLEEELQKELFVKQGRNIQLTEFGRMFRSEAAGLLEYYENVLKKVRSVKQGYRQTFMIGMTPLLIDSIFPSIIRRFQEKNQSVELSIQVTESSQLQGLIEDDQIDIGFSCLPSISEGLFCEKLFSDSITLAIPHDGYDLETAPAFDPYEIMSQSIIFTDHHPGYWERLKSEIQRHVPSPRFLKVSQSHAAKRFIQEGMGISFLPTFAINREIQEGRMLVVDTPFLDLPSCSIYSLHKYDHSYEKEFTAFVTDFLLT